MTDMSHSSCCHGANDNRRHSIDPLGSLCFHLEMIDDLSDPYLRRQRAAIYRQHKLATMSSMDQKRATRCAICHKKTKPSQPTDSNDSKSRLLFLPCKHLVHNDCGGKWGEKHDYCPTCKEIVFGRPEPSEK